MRDEVHDAERVGRVLDEGQQVLDPVLDVALAHADRDLLVEERLHRQRVGLAAVDARDGDGAAAADRVERRVQRREAVDARDVHDLLRDAVGQEARSLLRERGGGAAVRLHADGLDHGVGPAAVDHLAQLVSHVVGEVEGLDAVALGHGAALGDGIHRDDAVAEVLADAGRELADRAEAHDAERAALGHVRVLHALPGGGEDVAEEEVALVGELGVHDDRVDVGERHAEALGLAAGDGSVHLAEAVERGAAALRLHLRGLALREQALVAHEAVVARDDEGDDDAVADLELRDGAADLLDDAHVLVAEHVVLLEERSEDLVEVEVGSADRGRRDADHRVGVLLDHGVGDLLDLDVVDALPGECLHRAPSSSGADPRGTRAPPHNALAGCPPSEGQAASRQRGHPGAAIRELRARGRGPLRRSAPGSRSSTTRPDRGGSEGR